MRMTRLGLRLRRRLGEHGFTLMFALGVMSVCTLLIVAIFFAVSSDATLTQSDLNGKRAYAAAEAGAQAYLFQLNNNSAASKWWQTCSDDSGTATVPGNTNESYTYRPVITCTTNNAVGTVLDPTTGQLRIEFTGTSGTSTRTIVASFRTLSPLSYLWYTVYETEDTAIDSTGNCDRFYWQSPGPDSSCEIEWGSQDKVNGPMYTQDEFLLGGTPTFGRGPADSIASSAPSNSVCVGGPCTAGVLRGTQDPRAPLVPLPADNANLETDAQQHGVLLPAGTTTLSITGSTATAVTCTAASTCSTQTINLTSKSVLYAPNGSGCTSSYSPSDVPNPPQNSAGDYYGICGDVYVLGSTYNAGVTVAAENDIIIEGNLLNANDNAQGVPQGTAAMGLVADQYVRIGHPATFNGGNCSAANPDRTIDAAILTLQHSFFVDNYDCGNGTAYGTLTVYGAIAQKFRGIVAISNSTEGYAKNYNYDNRLAYLLPPYMFDLQDASWQVVRQTLCSASLPSTNPQSCSDQG
jgi:Tfp pilus assembly protein PilX